MDDAPSRDVVRRAPKVLLHDHLDGGLRPATVVDLAAASGYDGLPTTDVDALAAWFDQGTDGGGDLPRYLSAFAHTIAVMQTDEALHRVARECVQDLAADGVVYAEVRFAPELHTAEGLDLDGVLEAVVAGFADGCRDARGAIEVRPLVTALRSRDRSHEVADAAVRWQERGVIGFDLAGPEEGYPPTDHLAAFQTVHDAGLHLTVHAGEGAGLASIREALHPCGAERLGHGVRIADDVRLVDGQLALGRTASYVRDRMVPLEVCPTSNVHTGIAADVAEHPVGLLLAAGFRVTINTDNRLMSRITLTDELCALVAAFGLDLDDLENLAVAAADASFLSLPDRERLVTEELQPGYAALRSGSPAAGD